MATIHANVSSMFSSLKPWDVQNSIANLGPAAARLTWDNALLIAENHGDWLETPVAEACQNLRDWMGRMGDWEAEEIAQQSELELLGLFVQLIVSELRQHLQADKVELARSVEIYEGTDWEAESASPTGSYYAGEKCVMVEYYTGC